VDPATLAAVAVAALVRYVVGKAAGVAGRAGRDIDAVVDDRLDRLYETVRESLSGDRRGDRTLHELEDHPADIRRQGRLELALEGAIEDDPEFGGQLAAILEDLSQRPPPGGLVIRGTGPVAGGDIVITAGRDAAGRDLTSTDRDER
jgi:hypothetical protein